MASCPDIFRGKLILGQLLIDRKTLRNSQNNSLRAIIILFIIFVIQFRVIDQKIQFLGNQLIGQLCGRALLQINLDLRIPMGKLAQHARKYKRGKKDRSANRQLARQKPI